MSVRWMMIICLVLPRVAWSSQEADPTQVTILIAFDSRTGNTEAFARAISEGVATVDGVASVLRKQSDVDDADITGADGILVGSPVHWSNLSADTKRFLDRIGGVLASKGELGSDSTPTNRTAGAFVTGGSVASGKELARLGILASFLGFKFVVVGGEDAGGFGTLGPQATTGSSDPGLGDTELEEARRYGARFATLTKQLRR